jgi:hypothetical protein
VIGAHLVLSAVARQLALEEQMSLLLASDFSQIARHCSAVR